MLTLESSEHDANLESVGPKLRPRIGFAPWAMKCLIGVIEGWNRKSEYRKTKIDHIKKNEEGGATRNRE